MRCPACGESVTPDMEFCRSCLGTLPRDRDVPSIVAAPPVPSTQPEVVEPEPPAETCPRHTGMPFLDVCVDCGERICEQCSREMEMKAKPRCDRCTLRREKAEAVRQKNLWPTLVVALLVIVAFSVVRVLTNRPPSRAQQMVDEMKRISEDAQRSVDVSEELEAADRILNR